MDYQNFLFRPHAIHHIMGGVPKQLTATQQKTYKDLLPRYNGEGKPLTAKQSMTIQGIEEKMNAKCYLTEGAKKFLKELVIKDLTKRTTFLKNKYLDKGIQEEDRSITTYSNVLDTLLIKNKERKTNDFFTGECDNSQGKIRDIKTSWSFETFPLMDDQIKNKGYEWQLDCYMDLWGLKESELVYVLVDTPAYLLEDELKRACYKFNILDTPTEEQKQLLVEIVNNHIYTGEGLKGFLNQTDLLKSTDFLDFVEFPEPLRVKVFNHSFCVKRNTQLKEMIALSRDYMDKCYQEIPENYKKIINLKNELTAA